MCPMEELRNCNQGDEERHQTKSQPELLNTSADP